MNSIDFALPSGYSGFPIKLKAQWQLARHLLNITTGNGYNRTIKEVYIEREDFENAPDRTAVNAWWQGDRVLNANRNDATIGVYSVESIVMLDFILDSTDPNTERGFTQADVEKYFLAKANRNDCLPEDGGAGTIQSMMVAAVIPWGNAQTEPRCGMNMELKVWYKTKMGDPYTRP